MQQTSSGKLSKRDVCWYFRNLWASLTLREMSGAFGDLGTFLPLMVRRQALPHHP
jgi:hypothetical protein